MPDILSMIQMTRMTPAPGVLIVALLSLGYLCSSDIFALINYVGFATWVIISFQKYFQFYGLKSTKINFGLGLDLLLSEFHSDSSTKKEYFKA